MGSCFDSELIPDPSLTMPHEEVERKCKDAFDQSRYENGHGGYSGTLAEKYDVELDLSVVFATQDDARTYIDREADKWGPAICVPIKGVGWLVGARCSS